VKNLRIERKKKWGGKGGGGRGGEVGRTLDRHKLQLGWGGVGSSSGGGSRKPTPKNKKESIGKLGRKPGSLAESQYRVDGQAGRRLLTSKNI